MPMCSASPRTPALLRGCSGAASIWGKEGILPPASSSSSHCRINVSRCVYWSWSYKLVRLALTGLRSPPSHNPLPRFQDCVYRVASATNISEFQDFGGAHPKGVDALAEMPEAQIALRLTHPPIRAQSSPRRKDAAEDSANATFKSSCIQLRLPFYRFVVFFLASRVRSDTAVLSRPSNATLFPHHHS